jgi:hypothetical protein
MYRYTIQEKDKLIDSLKLKLIHQPDTTYNLMSNSTAEVDEGLLYDYNCK